MLSGLVDIVLPVPAAESPIPPVTAVGQLTKFQRAVLNTILLLVQPAATFVDVFRPCDLSTLCRSHSPGVRWLLTRPCS